MSRGPQAKDAVGHRYASGPALCAQRGWVVGTVLVSSEWSEPRLIVGIDAVEVLLRVTTPNKTQRRGVKWLPTDVHERGTEPPVLVSVPAVAKPKKKRLGPDDAPQTRGTLYVLRIYEVEHDASTRWLVDAACTCEVCRGTARVTYELYECIKKANDSVCRQAAIKVARMRGSAHEPKVIVPYPRSATR